MGLDVYLEKIIDPEKAKAWTEIYNEYERWWNSEEADLFPDVKYEDMTEEQKEQDSEHRRQKRIEMGLEPSEDDIYTEETTRWAHQIGKQRAYYDNPHELCIQIDSKIKPGHMFKIGYFRSSYNSGGINNIMQERIGTDLFKLFEYEDTDDGKFRPDWEKAKANVQAALEQLQAAVAQSDGVEVMDVSFMHIGRHNPPITTEKEALAAFIEEKEKKGDNASGCYSNASGVFSWEPLEVLAVIPGARRNVIAQVLGKGDAIEPVAFVVYRSQRGDQETPLQWYFDALKICIETCDYVLNSDDPDSYYMCWSY